MSQWLDGFYTAPVALLLSGIVLLAIGLLSWRDKGRQAVLGLCLFLHIRDMVWRGLYTLNSDDVVSTMISWTVYLAEAYGLFQFFFFSYQAWSPLKRQPLPIKDIPTVDILVTVFNEPLHILERTLVGCLAQDYPKERFQIYVLDDGHRDDVKAFTNSLGCHYLRRPERHHAKAGNLNHGLKHSSGELVAVFDVDHVPVRTFLQKTVGFFSDEHVAIVQTPHHFYNPDIFQRNLRVEREVRNEQALFFRMLQAGRDSHNSAFFAGSSGLFRRKPLEEVGGFRTETLTEDLHTSLLIHAKGYKSCYLNEVVSAGLMPETFDGYLKQRTRWAMGSVQVFLRDNPLIKRGLSLPQRIDYFGSIYYFFFGLARIICLTAPLSWLFFGLVVLKAETLMLVNFFFSYYLASAMAIRTISKGTRNAFWSDVYEVAMCFALTRAVLNALAAPRKKRTFEVTPKGQRIEKKGIGEASFIWFHLVLFGLLVIGLINGIQQWMAPTQVEGLGISMLWASINLLLLTLAIFSARELPQWRHFLRLRRPYPCQVVIGPKKAEATTVDLNERGMALSLTEPLFTRERFLTVILQTATDELLTLKGEIVRQEQTEAGEVQLGIKFVDPDDHTIHVLIEKLFSASDSWDESSGSEAGMVRSFWSFLRAFAVSHAPLRPSRRRTPRIPLQKPCQLFLPGLILRGTTQDVSFTGLCVAFPGNQALALERGLLHLESVVLKVMPISSVQQHGRTIVRFKIESIEKGEREWEAFHSVSSRRS